VIKIDVSGQQVGQVNGLSVVGGSDLSFGRFSRITVSASWGAGPIGIEREASWAVQSTPRVC
jgi:predicted ATP-dependent protease